MELMEGLLTRRSIRSFDVSRDIDDDTITRLLIAAQYAPSAHNRQPWEFLVVRDRQMLTDLRTVQRWTSFAKDAAAAVIVCARDDIAFSREKDGEIWSYADIDCSLATQNLLLAAHAMGLGACFCGCAPMAKVVDAVREMFKIPEPARPFAIVVLGWPADPDETKTIPERFAEEKVHWGQW